MTKLFFSASANGFYLDDLHDDLPDDAVGITAEEHQGLLRGQEVGQRIVAGPDGRPRLVDVQMNVPLAAIKQALLAQIDAAAETNRLKYITAGEGQALTYSRKADEARRAIADPAPAEDDYPLLAASVGIDGENIKAVAEIVLAMDAAWLQIGSQIERVRLTAKRAIEEATDEQSARAVVGEIVWPEAS